MFPIKGKIHERSSLSTKGYKLSTNPEMIKRLLGHDGFVNIGEKGTVRLFKDNNWDKFLGRVPNPVIERK
jgi:hypothetical protein